MLKDIKTNKCPICGCTDIISESVDTTALGEIHTHCNGTRWEHRRFLCGKEICYEPNFKREVAKGNCKNDEEYLAKIRKQKEDKEKLLSFCKENEINKNMIDKIEVFL